ncbi:MAG TPA: DUF4038 domain-containing protein [Polyangiaceae bacterium]
MSLAMLLCALSSLLGCGQGGQGASLAEETGVARFPLTAPVYPLHVQGRWLYDQSGAPFFWAGDTGWSLIAQLNQADVEAYLDNRRDKGFTIVLANLLERRFATNAPANIYGQSPFSGPIFQGLPGSANAAYFQHADFVIREAGERGIAVLLAPLYLGYQCGAEGFCDALRAASVDDVRRWAEYVGNRYRAFDNIVWVVGGDADPSGEATKVRAFAVRLNEIVGDRHPITAHNQPESYATTAWPNESWLDLENVYYPAPEQTYDRAQAAYQRAPTRPFFHIESRYENENSTGQGLRSVPYYTVLGGGMGATFGNCPVWHFGSAPSWCNRGDWRAALNDPGAASMRVMHDLFRSRAFQLLVPDFSNGIIAAGAQTGGNRAVAAAASDKRTIIAYLPSQRAVTIRMDRLSGTSANAWWVNAATGASTAAGTHATTGVRDFTPPSSGDWVLVIDDAAYGLPAPGTPAAPVSQPPTVATPAAASPSPTKSTATALSVLGADDGGASALRYTWSVVSAPNGGTVSFSPNASNAARSSTATFNAAGTYVLRATITDADGQSVTSDATVVAEATASSVSVSPAQASVSTLGTLPFTASVRDQFGAPMSGTVTWSVSGGGTISSSGVFTAGSTAGGPHTVRAQSAAFAGQASVTVTAQPPAGDTVVLGNSNQTTGMTSQNNFINAARFSASSNTTIEALEIYIRGGSGSIKMAIYSDVGGRPGSLLASSAEITSSAVGWNRASLSAPLSVTSGTFYWLCFNVSSSSLSVGLTSSGGTLFWRSFSYTSAWPTSAGTFSGPLADNFAIRALHVSAPPPPTNAAPTVAQPAASSPSSITGTTATLSVLGADDKGEAALRYTWSAPVVPAGATPVFSANASNAAKSSVVTFERAGNYQFSVTIVDAEGASSQSSVSVSVQQTLSTVSVSPSSAQTQVSRTQTFSATARDQFGMTLNPSPVFAWTTSGGGTISTSGVFTAGGTPGGPFTIRATSGSSSGTASVTVTAATDTTPPTGSIVINGGASSVSGSQVTLTLNASDASGVTSMRIANSCSNFPSSVPYATSRTHTLSSGTGTKTVCVQFQDAAGNWSGSFSDTIFRRR